MKSDGSVIKTAAAALIFAALWGPALAEPKFKILRFDQLLDWTKDDHSAALQVFTVSCQDISAPEWAPICAFARKQPDARAFFELFFVPVVIDAHRAALFTGYYEPELNGSLKRGGVFQYPIYRTPKSLRKGRPFSTRAEIDAGVLAGQGLEIAWVDDPVEAYYLHIQGSGRIKLADGSAIRVGYAAENGQVYRSAARELVRTGALTYSQTSIKGIKNWVRKNPVLGKKALQHNASYVFFRVVKSLSDEQGPMGALDLPITAMRSIAVDPKFTQMGAPVWVEKGGRNAFRRLMIAQDVGSAIKGPQRADIFFGTGQVAGNLAGETKNRGRMVVLLPIEIANRLVPEG